MHPTPIQSAATVVLALAVIHTFAASYIRHISHRAAEGSLWRSLGHVLSEVELVFALWAGILIVVTGLLGGGSEVVRYLAGLSFQEPFFVLVIMVVASTRPIITVAEKLVVAVSYLLPFGRLQAIFVSCLTTGPLLGSLITEPAAMTVTAFILKTRYFELGISDRFKYIALATLLVNVSIGGVLTSFAAPPVLMVASTWQWDWRFMISTFGWKSAVAILINAGFAWLALRREFVSVPASDTEPLKTHMPGWLTMTHLLLLAVIVSVAHDVLLLAIMFLLFLGIVGATKRYQDTLKLRESLFVALFLGGLVVIGTLQAWWLDPFIRDMSHFPLFIGATALTAFVDNAALTYLGSRIQGVSDAFKFALVAGAIAGGGLTVIANAPNPAAFAILQDHFGADGISAYRLARSALIPTTVSMLCLWFLP